LKNKLQEAKRNEEFLNKQPNEKQQNCKKTETDIVQLKMELEKGNNQSIFENSSKILNNILNSQRSPNNKT
jgi:hypothetical protein